MASIFTRIINGEIPSYKIAEDEKHYAFLDINPLAKGHTLVVPKDEVDYIFDLSAKALADLMTFAQRVAKAIEAEVPCERIGVAVIGLEVPHAHVHLSPINGISDLDFSKPKLNLTSDEFAELAGRIAARYNESA
jgi:histidine triad (HIT) family protein